MDIGKQIRTARKAKGLTLEALAHQVETDTGNLSRLERGIQGASQELLTRIMNALGMRISLEDSNSPSQTALASKGSNVADADRPNGITRSYPVISWIGAGDWKDSPATPGNEAHHDWLMSFENAGAHGFWLTVRGDSMTCTGNPSFPEGSRILVKPEADLVSGKYYVVEMLDSGEKTFKQYVEDAGIRYLRPLNTAYRTIEIDGNCRFIGRVIDTKMSGL